jgi:hypothetical protein
MFGVAPRSYLDDLVTIYQDVGSDATAFANFLAGTPLFQSTNYFPSFLTAEETATKMAAHFGLTDITSGAGQTAYDYFLSEINAGQSLGNLFATGVAFLSQTPGTSRV